MIFFDNIETGMKIFSTRPSPATPLSEHKRKYCGCGKIYFEILMDSHSVSRSLSGPAQRLVTVNMPSQKIGAIEVQQFIQTVSQTKKLHR
jgi:hypothetical protein